MANLTTLTILSIILLCLSPIQAQLDQLPQDNLGQYQVQTCCPPGFNAAGEYCVRCAEPAHWNPFTQKCVTCDPNEPWNN
jgi:hypothetical protein